MSFSPELCEIRFGCGLSPQIDPARSRQAFLDALGQPDAMARRFPVDTFDVYSRHFKKVGEIRTNARRAADKTGMRREIRDLRRQMVQESYGWHLNLLLRWSWSEQPLLERMTVFWADHFTALGKNGLMRPAVLPYVEEAIRPNVSGRFSDLLIAAVTHPLMLHYLDQTRSVGPASVAASRSLRLDGLNENLAREVLELHTLGAGGPYDQADVRQLAELFTGLSVGKQSKFLFRRGFTEPGPETVLGKQYGGGPPSIEPIRSVLQDLAVHPATARHIARKLAVHFVSDRPAQGLVDHLAARFLETGGTLMAVNEALLEHPAAWQLTDRNVKPPFDFVASTCRALAVRPERMQAFGPKALRRGLARPLAAMGQPLSQPNGPDGWPEADGAWITPQAVSARLRWALTVPGHLQPDLPDPRQFVHSALGSFASQTVKFAARSAESRSDAIGLVLASPAFQRR